MSHRPTRSEHRTDTGEYFLASIVESSDDAIIGKTLEGVITSWNRGAERIFGYSASEAVGQPVTILIPRPLWDEEALILERLARGERIEHFETTRVAKDGTVVDISLTISPIRDATGQIIGISKIARDISSAKRTLGALTRQAKLLDLAFEAILVRDGDDRIVYWNRGAENVYGWTAAEAVGGISHDLLKTSFPASLEQIRSEIRERGHWRGELQHTKKDGARISVLSHWVREGDGASGIVLETNFDLTEQKRRIEQQERARAELELEQNYRDLIQHAPDAILQIDRTRDILVVNAAAERMFGFSARDLTGRNLARILPGYPPLDDATDQSEDNSAWQAQEGMARRADGSYFPVDVNANPPLSHRASRTTVVLRDITERKAAQEEIRRLQERSVDELKQRNAESERLNRLKSEFMASVSHELRTPLHTIIGFSELLEEETVDLLEPRQKKYIGHIRRDSEHLLNLINDVLDLSRIEAGGIVLQAGEVDAHGVLEEILSSVERQAEQKGIAVSAHVVESKILADPHRFRQVVENLLTNAMKFTPGGGAIRLESSVAGQFLRVRVIDSGVGIPLSEQKLIFEKFYQVGNTTSGVRQGTGLGLAICRQLVEIQGGELWVESEPGQGSCFSFTVPIAGR